MNNGTGARQASLTRTTSESSVTLSLDLDGSGKSTINTTVPFFDHMLTAFAKHSLTDLNIQAKGDTDIDVHHTVEDTAIVLGQAIREALGDKSGISRYGDALVPLDEALARAVVDISGRPFLVHSGERFSVLFIVTFLDNGSRTGRGTELLVGLTALLALILFSRSVGVRSRTYRVGGGTGGRAGG